jgi:hypothetical protein
MKSKNYIPPNDGKFLEWIKNFLAYLVLNAARWRIEPESWRELEMLTTQYEEAYVKLEEPNHGKADVLLKTQCRETLEKSTRLFVKEYVANNHLVSDDDRIHLAVTIRDTKPTLSPVCDKPPFITIALLAAGIILIKFGNIETGKKGKPVGQSGAEMVYAILDHKPQDWDELTHSIYSTSSPFRLSFKGTERGKVLYFALRWQNTRGEKGPWTEIMSVIIP